MKETIFIIVTETSTKNESDRYGFLAKCTGFLKKEEAYDELTKRMFSHAKQEKKMTKEEIIETIQNFFLYNPSYYSFGTDGEDLITEFVKEIPVITEPGRIAAEYQTYHILITEKEKNEKNIEYTAYCNLKDAQEELKKTFTQCCKDKFEEIQKEPAFSIEKKPNWFCIVCNNYEAFASVQTIERQHE